MLHNHKKKIYVALNKFNNSKNIFNKKNILREILHLKNNFPNPKLNTDVGNFLREKFTKIGYDNIEHKTTSGQFVEYFLNKDYFLSFDPFTFMSIIASLCGCVSVVKKIYGLTFEEWVNGDPFNKYGVAYGHEGIEHALSTQHLLLDHITNMYLENDNNIINLMKNIETHFNIKINNSRT
jgi:hypothetical protein